MDKSKFNKQPPKRCFCARCLMPIEEGDKINIEGHNYHKKCTMCSFCRTMATSIKMYHGCVFCNECFKTQVLTRFRGEPPRIHSNSWWMQWAPGRRPPLNAVAAQDGEADLAGCPTAVANVALPDANTALVRPKSNAALTGGNAVLAVVRAGGPADLAGGPVVLAGGNLALNGGATHIASPVNVANPNATLNGGPTALGGAPVAINGGVTLPAANPAFANGHPSFVGGPAVLAGGHPAFTIAHPGDHIVFAGNPAYASHHSHTGHAAHGPHAAQEAHMAQEVHRSRKMEVKDESKDRIQEQEIKVQEHNSEQRVQRAILNEHVKREQFEYQGRDVIELKTPSAESCKKYICARCLQPIEVKIKVDIGNHSYHPQCARCDFCHSIPGDHLKIYYGHLICEECFRKCLIVNKQQDESHTCCGHWQNNIQLGNNEHMREMIDQKTGKDTSQSLYMVQQVQQAQRPLSTGACRYSNHHQHQECWPHSEPKQSATPATSVADESSGTWDLSFEHRTEGSDLQDDARSRESTCQDNLIVAAAAEKIEKLTRYLKYNLDSDRGFKQWKSYTENDKSSISEVDPCWVDLQDHKIVMNNTGSAKCLWHCGPIFVNYEYFRT